MCRMVSLCAARNRTRVQIKVDAPQRLGGPPMCPLQPKDYYTILTCKGVFHSPGRFCPLCLQFKTGFVRSSDP